MAETMLFTSNNTSIPADLFKSGGTPNGGVILIAHGTHGLLDPWGEQILGYGAALADVGFIALVPHYFDSTQTRPGVPAAEVIEPNRPTWQRALADAVAHATALPGADPSRIGLLGFSLGGHLCLQLRAMAKVLVAFFAPAFDLKTGSTNTLFAQVHHGKADEAVAFDVNFRQIIAMLEGEGTVCDPHEYPNANHGFIGNDPDNTNARKESRKLTLEFFADHL